MDKEFYIPTPQNLAAQSQTNRQGRAEVLTGAEAEYVLELLQTDARHVYTHYELMLNGVDKKIVPDSKGLARELARMNLTLNYYTQWYWKIDLHNLLHFLSLRADSHAQYEIRAYADAMLNEIVKPLAYEAFIDFIHEGMRLSRHEVALLKQMIDPVKRLEAIPQKEMTKREWEEFCAKFDIPL